MYSHSVYARALEKKERAAKIKKQAYINALGEAQRCCAELEQISLKLKKNGAEVAKCYLAGDTVGADKIIKQSLELTSRKQHIEQEIGVCEPEADCTLCNDTGYVKGRICKCVEAIAKEIAYADLAKDAPLAQSSFDNFSLEYYSDNSENGMSDKARMSAIYDYCKNYAANFTAGADSILLLGGTGLGKTHLSLAVAGEVIKKGYAVIYGTAQNLFNQMNREHFSYGDDTDRLMQEAIDCDLLIIDDLGTEFSTQFTLSCVYNIINTRILKGKPCVISSNYSLSELEKIYSPRVMSRIIGYYTMKQFFGSDIRQIKAINKLKAGK